MKKTHFLYLAIFGYFTFGCSSEKKPYGGLPFIDVRKNYPEKELILTDIAAVTYVHLNTRNDEYLYKEGIRCVTKNTIVVYDNLTGSILFFSKDGKPKSRFNRKGQGAEDYINLRQLIFDEDTDEVFVLSNWTKFQVYSSSGTYKRTFFLPQGTLVNPCISFDNESLLIYDSSIERKKAFPNIKNFGDEFFEHPFVLISKSDGKVLEYIDLPSNTILLTDLRINRENGGVSAVKSRLIKCKDGVLLCNPETDTVFCYDKKGSLIPVFCKIPLVSETDPMIYMNNCVDVGNYQFIEIVTVRWEEGAFPFPVKYFMRDKKTGEVFRQKLVMPDFIGKEFLISPSRSGIDYENGPWVELDLFELKQANFENRLNGKLKELVSTLDEDEDNNVFMFIDFK